MHNLDVVQVHRGAQARHSEPRNLGDTSIYTDDLFSESREWLEAACQGVDTIIHAAWYVEPGKYLRSVLNVDCLIGTLRFAQAAASAGVRRFVGIGTCLEYKLLDFPLTVESPLGPLTPYAAAKASSCLVLSQLLPALNVEFAWCRLFYLYGKDEDPRRLVPYVRSQLAAGKPVELTSGTQIRDYLDVQVAGEMIAEIAMGYEQGAFNICSGVPITVREFVENIADEYNARHLLQFGRHPQSPDDPPCVWGKLR